MIAELTQWLSKTFGEPKHGNLLNLSEQITVKENPKTHIQYRITELRLTYQVRVYDNELINPDNYEAWKKEIDVITDNSIRQFHCEDSNLYAANQREIKSGKSFLLTLVVFHKTEI